MNSVFLLWHTYEVGDDSEQKFIGVYRTRQEAESAIHRVRDKPGFKEWQDGFEIHEHVLGRDGWTEGFMTAAEALTGQSKERPNASPD